MEDFPTNLNGGTVNPGAVRLWSDLQSMLDTATAPRIHGALSDPQPPAYDDAEKYHRAQILQDLFDVNGKIKPSATAPKVLDADIELGLLSPDQIRQLRDLNHAKTSDEIAFERKRLGDRVQGERRLIEQREAKLQAEREAKDPEIRARREAMEELKAKMEAVAKGPRTWRN